MIKRKHIFLLLVILISMLCISAVSAADDASGEIISTDNGIALDEGINDALSSNDDELILDDNNDDGLVDSGKAKSALAEGETTTGSFTDLYNDIKYKSEVTLRRDYKFNGTEVDDSDFINGITISSAVTIDGDGHTIDGNHLARIFFANDEVVFKNINFKNGNTTENGGAIYKGTAYNCNFTDNTAYIHGGAIYYTTAYNCNFTGNTAEKGGGAMFEGTAYNCSFSGNTAMIGGAMYYGTAYNCNFTGNTAYIHGGAIYYTTAYNCNFTGNTAEKGGGAMFEGTSVLCTFENNDCHETTFAPFFDISEFITTADSDEKLFFNLTYDGQVYTGLNTTMVVSNGVTATFVGDSEGYDIDLPAGIYKASLTLTDYPEVKGEITIKVTDGATFLDLNKTINNNTDSMIVLDRNYTYNETFDGAFKDGVVISRALTIDGNGSTIDGLNTARIFNVTAKNVELSNITFKNGNSSKYGGAVYFFNGGSIIGCSFISNHASIGGAVYFYEGYSAVYKSSFVNNSAGNFSAVHLSFDNSEVHRCIFVNNTAQNGVIGQAWDSYKSMNITDNIFLNNNGNNAIDLADLGSFDVGNNWFGSTGENYTAKVNDNVDKWLFLNGTANPKSMDISSTSDIIFKLFAYDNNTGEINATYDNSNLPIVNLTISKTNGNIKDSALFDEKLTFTPVSLGAASVTATIFDLECTIELDVKANTKLTAANVSTTYNVAKDLIITLKDADGNPIRGATVTVDLNGAKKYTTDKKGQVKVAVGKLVPKTYTAKISFAGNNLYKASSATAKVTVKKATPKMTAKAKTFKFEDKTKKYTVTLKNNKGAVMKNTKVSLKVGGKTYTAKTNSKGVATFKLTKLTKKGKFNAVITYAGNKYYKKLTKKAKITVKAPAWKTVAKGSKDKATVKKIQQALKDNGYYLTYKGHYLKVDGKYSSCTERSVKQFQKAKGLSVTGKVDYATAKKLKLVS